MAEIEIKKTFAHSDDDEGDVRMELRIGRHSGLYRHWDDDDDYYEDDRRYNEFPGLIFDMMRTAMAQHRHELRKKEKSDEDEDETPDKK